MLPVKNILLIRLKSIGDVTFTLPAVNALRDNFPSAQITFLTSKENGPLLRGFQAVNDVIPLDRAAFRGGNPVKVVPGFFSLLRRLRAGKFDLAVDFQGYGETAWLAWLSGAPRRWGSVYGKGRRWAYTCGVTREKRIHLVDWNLSLLRQCGLPPVPIRNEFVLPEDATAEARRFFLAAGLNPAKPTLFIQPFTSSPQKNWPLDRHLAVARHWQAKGFQILFGGGPSELAALNPVRQAGFAVSAGVPLLVTVGLVKLSRLILGGDTGVLHLAVALGRRVVMLVDPAVLGRTEPFQHPDWAVIPPNDRLISNIQTDTVIQACARAFDEIRSATG